LVVQLVMSIRRCGQFQVLRDWREQNKLHGVDSSFALITGRYVPCLQGGGATQLMLTTPPQREADPNEPKYYAMEILCKETGPRMEKACRGWAGLTRTVLETSLPCSPGHCGPRDQEVPIRVNSRATWEVRARRGGAVPGFERATTRNGDGTHGRMRIVED
jgi:hypothetical protein